jgi:uncharacterized damage-inducible protein DinB
MIKEIQGYLTKLGEIRNQVKAQLEGLPPEALDWRPTRETGELATNSLAVIAAHVAGSQVYWLKEIISHQPIQRDRDAEFATQGVRAEDLMAKLDAVGRVTEEVLSSFGEAQLDEGRRYRDRQITVRWGILHVIEHVCQHLGHMQLTRQLWLTQKKK